MAHFLKKLPIVKRMTPLFSKVLVFFFVGPSSLLHKDCYLELYKDPL